MTRSVKSGAAVRAARMDDICLPHARAMSYWAAAIQLLAIGAGNIGAGVVECTRGLLTETAALRTFTVRGFATLR